MHDDPVGFDILRRAGRVSTRGVASFVPVLLQLKLYLEVCLMPGWRLILPGWRWLHELQPSQSVIEPASLGLARRAGSGVSPWGRRFRLRFIGVIYICLEGFSIRK